MMRRTAILVMTLLSLAFAGTSYADPPAHAGKGHGQADKQKAVEQRDKGRDSPGSHGKRHDADHSGLIRATITALAARDIARHGGWFGYQPLPPGIAKNLARGKPLPPGIAKKNLPTGMLRKLPAYAGYEWYAAGRDLVLVSLATMLIADVLHDVFD